MFLVGREAYSLARLAKFLCTNLVAEETALKLVIDEDQRTARLSGGDFTLAVRRCSSYRGVNSLRRLRDNPRTRAHIPVTCCARTRKMSETAAISQECGADGEKVDGLLRCDIFGPSPLPVCVKSVSHAVPSYIPVEIIHGESTPACLAGPACRRTRRTVTPQSSQVALIVSAP